MFIRDTGFIIFHLKHTITNISKMYFMLRREPLLFIKNNTDDLKLGKEKVKLKEFIYRRLCLHVQIRHISN